MAFKPVYDPIGVTSSDTVITIGDCRTRDFSSYSYSDRQKKVLNIYLDRHFANAHKMAMPPICSIENLRK